MLFNSYVFILAFLPLVLAVYFLLGRLPERICANKVFLILASFVFYGWREILVMAVSAIFVAVHYGNIWFVLPNAFTIAATTFSLANVNRSKFEVVRGTRAYRNEQARREREEMKRKMKGQ